jgi:hypothetical protein
MKVKNANMLFLEIKLNKNSNSFYFKDKLSITSNKGSKFNMNILVEDLLLLVNSPDIKWVKIKA